MNKFGSGSRATFISPYLRRPLRPLHKVLSEREERADDSVLQEPANNDASEYGSTTWGVVSKSAAASD